MEKEQKDMERGRGGRQQVRAGGRSRRAREGSGAASTEAAGGGGPGRGGQKERGAERGLALGRVQPRAGCGETLRRPSREEESSPVPICALNRSCSRVTSADRMSMPRRTTCKGKQWALASGPLGAWRLRPPAAGAPPHLWLRLGPGARASADRG